MSTEVNRNNPKHYRHNAKLVGPRRPPKDPMVAAVEPVKAKVEVTAKPVAAATKKAPGSKGGESSPKAVS